MRRKEWGGTRCPRRVWSKIAERGAAIRFDGHVAAVHPAVSRRLDGGFARCTKWHESRFDGQNSRSIAKTRRVARRMAGLPLKPEQIADCVAGVVEKRWPRLIKTRPLGGEITRFRPQSRQIAGNASKLLRDTRAHGRVPHESARFTAGTRQFTTGTRRHGFGTHEEQPERQQEQHRLTPVHPGTRGSGREQPRNTCVPSQVRPCGLKCGRNSAVQHRNRPVHRRSPPVPCGTPPTHYPARRGARVRTPRFTGRGAFTDPSPRF